MSAVRGREKLTSQPEHSGKWLRGTLYSHKSMKRDTDREREKRERQIEREREREKKRREREKKKRERLRD